MEPPLNRQGRGSSRGVLAGVLLVIGLLGSLLILQGTFVHAGPTVFMATTTSTRDSGILDHLLPVFEARSGITVLYTAVGTGQALEYGRRGDADIVMVHAPDLEREFVASGHGTMRYEFMYNRFILVGPPADPAGVGGEGNVTLAFRKIYTSGSAFVSRGDASGTHHREMDIWGLAGYDYASEVDVRRNAWYVNVSAGMGKTLLVSNELGAYTLTDEGTFYSYVARLDLIPLVQGDPLLFNQYSVIPVDPAVHPGVRYDLAVRLACFLLSGEAQALIAEYEVSGHNLFTPDASEHC